MLEMLHCFKPCSNLIPRFRTYDFGSCFNSSPRKVRKVTDFISANHPKALFFSKTVAGFKVDETLPATNGGTFPAGFLWFWGNLKIRWILTGPNLWMDVNQEIPNNRTTDSASILGVKIDPKKSHLSWHRFISHPPPHCNHLLHHLLGKMWYSETQTFAPSTKHSPVDPIF